jgi:hypothetical protein
MSITKLETLGRLNEAELRERVLVPLLSRLGLRAPTIYHGTREYGKDIICFDYDRLGQRVYHGIVAKATDLSGSVSDPNGLFGVINQVEQSFHVPYRDLFGMREITMDQVWVVTSGRIIPGAADSVMNVLRGRLLDRRVRFVSGEQLVDLIDEHLCEFPKLCR